MAMIESTDIAMLFVRCRGGISHHPDEHVSERGCRGRRARADALHREFPAAGGGTPMTAAIEAAIREHLAARRDEQTRFLAELVRVPSDNPPGDCRSACGTRRRAVRGARLCGRAHRGAGRAGPRQRHDFRHQSHHPRALRRRAGDRAECAWRRRAAGAGLDAPTLMARRSATASCMGAASRCRNRISPLMALRCWR